MEEVRKKITLTWWGSQILTSILTSDIKFIKSGQKILSMNILRVFSDHHFWRQNWRQYLWTSLCQCNFFANLLHSLGVWFFWHLTSFWYFGSKLPMGPIAHTPVLHYPCIALPTCLIPVVPHTPVPLLPMCPIPPVGLIAHMPHTPSTLLPMWPIAHVPHHPCPHLDLIGISNIHWTHDLAHAHHVPML